MNSISSSVVEKDATDMSSDGKIGRYSNLIVNVYFVHSPETNEWTLMDAGLPFSADAIQKEAAREFGVNSRPNAIVLTHGHFDHVGSLIDLAKRWDVPIWTHRLEAPYLDGRSAYPPPDPTVGGGSMSLLSPLYPKGPIDVSRWLKILPEDGSVPPMPGWRWIHTPGHTHGHISLFREADRALIVGDAFSTTKQESMLAAVLKPHLIHGPPMYFTSDWTASLQSVIRLMTLDPGTAYPGHGNPVSGEQLKSDLVKLIRDFDERAKPKQGRYVSTPAVADENGVVSVPPAAAADAVPTLLCAAAVAAVIGLLLTFMFVTTSANRSSK